MNEGAAGTIAARRAAISVRLAALTSGVVGNLFSVAGGALISRVVTFLTMAIVARRVGAEAFGLLNFGTAVAAFAAIVVGPGFLVWGVRAVAQEREHAGNYLVLINTLQLGLATLAYAVLVVVAQFAFEPAERSVALAAGLNVFAVALSVEWTAQGLERFRLIAIVQIITSFVTAAATLAIVDGREDFLLVPIFTVGGQLLAAILGAAFLLGRKLITIHDIDWKPLGFILRKSLPLGISAAMITILHYANTISLQLSRGAAEVGQFGAGFRLWEILSTIPGLVSGVFLPRLTRLLVTDSPRATQEMRWYVRIVIALAGFPALLYATEAEALIRIIFAAEYLPAIPILRLFSVAVLFNFAAIAYITILLVHGDDRAYMASIAAGLVVSLIGGLTIVPLVGAVGAAITIACVDLVTWLVTLRPVHRRTGSWFLAEAVRPLAVSVAVALWLLVAQRFGLGFWPRVTLGAVAYTALVLPWRSIHELAPHSS